MVDGLYHWEDGGNFQGGWKGREPNWKNGTYKTAAGAVMEDRTEDAKRLNEVRPQ
jgi:hypothetical protein